MSFPRKKHKNEEHNRAEENWRLQESEDGASVSSSFERRRFSGASSSSNFQRREFSSWNRPKRQPSASASTSSDSYRRPTFFGFRFLEELSQKDPEAIILELAKDRDGLKHLLEKELSADAIVLIVKILKKLISSAFTDNKYTILQSAFNEKFVGKLRTFIACLPTQDGAQKRQSEKFWKNPKEFWEYLVDICENIMQTIPTFACKTLPVLINSLKVYIPIIELEQELIIDDEIKRRIEQLNQEIKLKTQENEDTMNEFKESSAKDIKPPDDFRNIEVYPKAEEILGKKGFLRENVVNGAYQSVEHYLDVQFRLLREDFVGPLREGVAAYRANTPLKEIENVKIQKNVYFLKHETINEFYCLRIEFASKNKKLNFENSRRFMYGSLLCFTKDNFKTLIFGKVAQRDKKDLNNGELIVAFDEEKEVVFNTPYLMVECGVYFEPYYHVLTVLKTMTEDNFPMERYFIRVNSSVQPPEYLTAPNCTYDIEDATFEPLGEWPQQSFYNMNESQMTAFKAAITQEICVIQGPPGTGKTFVGLQIAHTLLENAESWYDYTPMLVICYTNHALDQFLEGLLPFTKDIIRVGGQSKNNNLDAYNLRNHVERYVSVSDKRREVQDCLRNIKAITEKLKSIELFTGVIKFRLFHNVANFEGTWFSKAKDKDIIHWLVEGATFLQVKSQRKYRLEAMQVELEFNNIGFDDSGFDNEQTQNDLFDHIISKSEDIFKDIVNSTSKYDDHFLLFSLGTIREEITKIRDTIREMQQLPNPTLINFMEQEELFIILEELEKKFDYVKQQLNKGRNTANVSEPEMVDLQHPYNMPFEDRWKLYFYWLDLYKKEEQDVLRMTTEDFREEYKKYEELRNIADVKAMKEAMVVGMTTTSAARLRSSLQTLQNPIVIVEEAAEVLEAHIVTSITKQCKHLILIGDHKQLKPTTASMTVDKQYSLGISLFERMLINKIHCFTLNVQHRMRPEISALIKPHIYDFLQDHPTVFNRGPVLGIDKCVYFIEHEHPEEECDGSSKINYHEVTFFMQMAKHLILNGHDPQEITILAAYLGQFFAFVREKTKDDLLKNVRVAVLDNYQGEESNIILLSLVRNNDENKIGFLAIENRVCVALSRARNGLFIMGNMNLLCKNNKLWRKIKVILEKQGALGTELPLRCAIHEDQITLVKCQSDFYSVAEGGCTQLCNTELPCGHKCTYLCHIRDRSHARFRCQVPCRKLLCTENENHICKNVCSEECGLCKYKVLKQLPCGHEQNIECHITPEEYKCTVSVPTKLPCGHDVEKPCHKYPETFKCTYDCQERLSCGHACVDKCHIRKDPDHLEYKCMKECIRFREGCTVEEEEHRCKRKCFQQCDPCTVTVRKARTICPHMFDVPCNSDVDLIDCNKPCTKKLACGHKCKGLCGLDCPPCIERVNKNLDLCNHQVMVRCSEEPNRQLCKKKCPLKLKCGHLCTRNCNQECTSKCTEIVKCEGVLAQCGHLVTTMECYMVETRADPKLLVRFCNHPCDQQLKCGHKCAGSCGECLQGRIHKRCAEKCGTLLVCDHPCPTPCRQSCRPCTRKCEFRCEHSLCRKACGEICFPCKEWCARRCIHGFCRRYCFDFCSKPPCTEPCPLFLRCGHPCIGFCGDPCPGKCLVCNPEDVLEVFFGTESETARFVLLNDCKHVVESEGMERWLAQNQDQISYKVCPKCKTAIRTTQRYSDYTKRAMLDVASVKKVINGNSEQIEAIKKDMIAIVNTFKTTSRKPINHCPDFIDLINKIVPWVCGSKKNKRKPINIYQARSLKTKLQFIKQIADICCNQKMAHYSLKQSNSLFIPQVNLIVATLSQDIIFITDQEIEDLGLEIDRLSLMVDYFCIKVSGSTNYDTTAKQLTADIENELYSCKRFTKDFKDPLVEKLKQLSECTKSGIGISEREKHEIMKAMGFSKGHWFKCPNGHVYAIGECGGAMVESRCNECGATIGGTHHRLLPSNAVATEMDGARFGAWSENANMGNYRFDL